jgi:hypothetical protein
VIRGRRDRNRGKKEEIVEKKKRKRDKEIISGV